MMKINKCEQCGETYMYSTNDRRVENICETCTEKNKRAKLKKLKTETQIHTDQKQCVECNLWYFPKTHYQKICGEDCKKVRRKRFSKEHHDKRKQDIRYKLKNYKYATKNQLKNNSEDDLFRKANLCVIRLEIIDELLMKKFGKSLELMADLKEGNKND